MCVWCQWSVPSSMELPAATVVRQLVQVLACVCVCASARVQCLVVADGLGRVTAVVVAAPDVLALPAVCLCGPQRQGARR